LGGHGALRGSGLPLADAEISLYRADWRRGHRLVDQKRTGVDGLARFTNFGQRPDQYFLLARWQDHVAVDTSFLYGYEEPSLGSRAALSSTPTARCTGRSRPSTGRWWPSAAAATSSATAPRRARR